MSLRQRLRQRLDATRAQHRYRTPPLITRPPGHYTQLNGCQVINFAANDYLGLSEAPDIAQAACHQAPYFGSGAAHLVSGHHLAHHLLEDELAEWLGVERVLLFSTGYMANLAVQQALMEKGDLLLHDKLNHASLLDGAQLSSAQMKRYPHLDMQALARRLQQVSGQAMIVTDGVFSMDGDLAPLPEIMALKAKHGAWLLVDEAHALGVVGATGRGTFEHFGLQADEDVVRVGTLGKAFGVFGAFVAGTAEVVEALINFARPWIYTTALPPVNAEAARIALKKVQAAEAERTHLQQLIRHFRQGAQQLGLTLWPSETPIQPVILEEAERAVRWRDRLFEQGVYVPAIRPPTVPQGSARLRISLGARHTLEDVEILLDALAHCLKEERDA